MSEHIQERNQEVLDLAEELSFISQTLQYGELPPAEFNGAQASYLVGAGLVLQQISQRLRVLWEEMDSEADEVEKGGEAA